MRSQRIGLACGLAAVLPLTTYWLTCHRTITWWDSAQYSLGAETLGVVGPPGSVLLTLLGWFATRIPLGLPGAFTLNLFAGFLAALTILLVTRAAFDLHAVVRQNDQQPAPWLVDAAIALGALPLAFGPTLWRHAARFTPYVLTATFTALIIIALLRWWKHAARGPALGWIFTIALLIGLDFSVHRTNALLVPGVALWVAIRQPRVLTSVRTWMSGFAGLVCGLSTQLLLIPMAARGPALNMGDPSDLSRLWAYVSLEHVGGGFLLNVFPRRADFFTHQVHDVMDAITATYAATDGSLWLAGLIPLLLGGYGVVWMARRNVRLAVAFTTLLLTTILATVAYFNIPESYFRPLYRHYLPCLVILGVVVATGAGALAHDLWRRSQRQRIVAATIALALLAAGPAVRIGDDYATRDRSRSYFAYDYASNLLVHLPPDAILLTSGDNDTFPLWYLQTVEGVRTDVEVINIPLTNVSWYVEKVLCAPGGVDFSGSPSEMSGLQPLPWEERDVAIPTAPHETATGDSIHLRVPPSAGQYLLVQDRIALDLIRTNRWQRPVMVATTVSPAALSWIRDHLQLEGLAYRVVPSKSPPPNVDRLESNVMDNFRYRGYADPDVHIDVTSRSMGQNLVATFLSLADATRAAGNQRRCTEIIEEMERALPLARLQPAEQVASWAARVCESD